MSWSDLFADLIYNLEQSSVFRKGREELGIGWEKEIKKGKREIEEGKLEANNGKIEKRKEQKREERKERSKESEERKEQRKGKKNEREKGRKERKNKGRIPMNLTVTLGLSSKWWRLVFPERLCHWHASSRILNFTFGDSFNLSQSAL